MIRVQVTVPKDVLRAIRGTAARAPRTMLAIYRKRMEPVNRRYIGRLKHTPGSPQYPIRWKSERQRRAFFATNGFGRGIPSQRTGKVSDGWRVRQSSHPFQGTTTVSNDVPYAVFVYGSISAPNNWQQPFHQDTGWPNATEIVVEWSEVAEDTAIAAWFEATEATP